MFGRYIDIRRYFNMFEGFLDFKKDRAFNLMKKLFNVGLIILLIPAFMLGTYCSYLFPVNGQVQSEIPGMFTFAARPNYILGIITGITILIISIVIWKIICQGLLIVLQGFETYTSNNMEE